MHICICIYTYMCIYVYIYISVHPRSTSLLQTGQAGRQAVGTNDKPLENQALSITICIYIYVSIDKN